MGIGYYRTSSSTSVACHLRFGWVVSFALPRQSVGALGADFAVEVKPNYRGDVSHLGVNRTTLKPIPWDSYLPTRLSLKG